MPKDYYDDGAGEAAAPAGAATEEGQPAPAEGQGEAEAKPQETDQPTDVVNKSLLAGKDFKVGDEVVLRIIAFHGDQVEVEYASEKPGGGEAEGAGAEEPEPEADGGKMSAMYA